MGSKRDSTGNAANEGPSEAEVLYGLMMIDLVLVDKFQPKVGCVMVGTSVFPAPVPKQVVLTAKAQTAPGNWINLQF